MPVFAEWANDLHTIIRIHLHDPWISDEYLQASQQVRSMMLEVSTPVHVIVDMTNAWHIPKDIMSILPTINSHMLPGQGLVIGVRYFPYGRALVRFVGRVFPRMIQNLSFAYTLNEAFEIIADYEREKQSSQA